MAVSFLRKKTHFQKALSRFPLCITMATATSLGSGDWTQGYEDHKVSHTLKQVETSGGLGWGRGVVISEALLL